MAQNALDNMFSCYNGRKTYATLVQDAYSYQGQHLNTMQELQCVLQDGPHAQMQQKRSRSGFLLVQIQLSMQKQSDQQQNILISIEKAEQAVEYLRTSPNGKTDYIDYLFNIWHTNPVIRDTLSIIRALTINSASLERLFSFFHRQTASFLRGSINKETLIKMGIIYTEIMQPEIQRWKQQQLINKLIAKRKGISISEQLMHWNEF
ncbi:Hypothetical_protein [Hexamita inflata]|uniref:Hypothetical_protein n=1 Tax=Hexamita inflata TaxID=28002 RepID=A0AA86QN22_9EUKA|nr:Hypothetical protein HINF_LOCUS47262 [Hexamita inflata]